MITLNVGERVMLDGSHPHAGKVGTVSGHHDVAGSKGVPRIELDGGGGCYAFWPEEVIVLAPCPPKRKRTKGVKP